MYDKCDKYGRVCNAFKPGNAKWGVRVLLKYPLSEKS